MIGHYNRKPFYIPGLRRGIECSASLARPYFVKGENRNLTQDQTRRVVPPLKGAFFDYGPC